MVWTRQRNIPVVHLPHYNMMKWDQRLVTMHLSTFYGWSIVIQNPEVNIHHASVEWTVLPCVKGKRGRQVPL